MANAAVAGASSDPLVDFYQRISHYSSPRGQQFDPRTGQFVVGGSGLITPGQSAEVTGMNEFLRTQNAFRDTQRSLFNTTNQVGLDDAVSDAREQTDASFDSAEGQLERRQRALGLNMTARQRTSQTRHLSLGRAVSQASAQSGVRRGFRQLSQAASQEALGLGDALRNVQAGALTGLDNAAGQEAIRVANEEAADDAASAGMFGTIVSIGAALISSESMKHSKRPEGSLLDRLKKVRVEKWKYINEDADHIGPYAEEFNSTFGVGKDNKRMIHIGDAMGVLMGSIKELNAKVEARA
jgi:hypothetical protein